MERAHLPPRRLQDAPAARRAADNQPSPALRALVLAATAGAPCAMRLCLRCCPSSPRTVLSAVASIDLTAVAQGLPCMLSAWARQGGAVQVVPRLSRSKALAAGPC